MLSASFQSGRPLEARKTFFEGTHRSRPPAETFADYSRLMPRLGITRIATVTGLDRIGLPVCVAVRPNSRSLATSQGKGATLAAAKTSALMEAVESWHGERVAGPVFIKTRRELVDEGSAAGTAAFAVRADATFSAEHPIEWLGGWDLLDEAPTLLPFETVSSNFVEHPDRRPIFLKSTNGLASGNHRVEAVVHALLEVIERDALTLWSLRPAIECEARRVDLATIADAGLAGLIDTLGNKGVAVAIDDCTTDLGVPVYTCTLTDDPSSRHWRGVPRAAGHGAHLEPSIALSRAVHEAVQSRATLISGGRDDLFQRDYANASSRDDDARWIAEASAAALQFGRPAGPANSWFEEDLAFLLGRLRAVGMTSAIVVDLGRENIGVPVVKVVVPGLEPVRTALYRPGARAAALLRESAS